MKNKPVFLINCSNLKKGGGLQVADSVCGQLYRFPQHRFVVVLSSALQATRERIAGMANVVVVTYDIKNNPSTLFRGRDRFFDNLVKEENVVAVLTIFGPSRWRPQVPHLCGFARPHLVIKDSPYQQHLPLKEKIYYRIWKWLFQRSSDTFYTENSYISERLPEALGRSVRVFTVTNNYNQVYDAPEKWCRKLNLPSFEGTTLLSVTAAYAHKNLGIMIPIARLLEEQHPEFRFRFVLTVLECEMPIIPDNLKEHFLFLGKVDIAECPHLYKQADIMFMPTLLECFTATYPEAMRMEVPIVTTDLEFARGLCGDAACYYSAIDVKAAAEAIYRVATDKEYVQRLVENGKSQLQTYDTYEQRAEKLVKIMEEMAVAQQ